MKSTLTAYKERAYIYGYTKKFYLTIELVYSVLCTLCFYSESETLTTDIENIFITVQQQLLDVLPYKHCKCHCVLYGLFEMNDEISQ